MVLLLQKRLELLEAERDFELFNKVNAPTLGLEKAHQIKLERIDAVVKALNEILIEVQ